MAKITIERDLQKGSLEYKYRPLKNLYPNQNNTELKYFDTDKLKFDSEIPIDIECQDSYDGSVNLILNDGKTEPLLINSAFTVTSNGEYEKVKHNQSLVTNYYAEDTLNSISRLQRVVSEDYGFLKIELEQIIKGSLKGGNYVFLIKYMDEDYNETKIVAESGIVSVFKNPNSETLIATLEDEITNTGVVLKLSNLDTSYSRFKILYKRSYADLTGTLKWEFAEFTEPYKIALNAENTMYVTIHGIENTTEITYDSLLIKPNVYHNVKTQAQTQNLLFFGNVTETVESQVLLQQLSYYIQVQVKPKKLFGDQTNGSYTIRGGYSDPKNIYYNLGYMPEEIYRIGIVYIYEDDTESSAYNLLGCKFNTLSQWSHNNVYSSEKNIDTTSLFIESDPKNSNYYNTKGVFIMPSQSKQYDNNITLGLEFYISDDIKDQLKALGIKGYKYVRQKRIPNFLAQGYSLAISNATHTPLLYDAQKGNYFTQSPINIDEKNKTLDFNSVYTINNTYYKYIGLLCNDVILNPGLQSILDGSKFILKAIKKYTYANINYPEITLNQSDDDLSDIISATLIYVPGETSARIYKDRIFSTQCGNGVEVKTIKSLDWLPDNYDIRKLTNLVWGNYTPYIGLGDGTLKENTIYNIYLHDFSKSEELEKFIQSVAQNKDYYTAISDNLSIKSKNNTDSVMRGDCFVNVSSTKYQYNFLDYATPTAEMIVKADISELFVEDSAADNAHTYSSAKWEKLNISDLNAVPLGKILTYASISNYNLNIRAIDTQRVDEMALFGSARTFYPYSSYTTSPSFKLPDSTLLNAGLNTTQTALPYAEVELVPYIKHLFNNRIAFSKLMQQGGFANGYRVFQGLSYQDIDNSYGAIVKLLPLGANLFCVFEHGCGIVPVNEKALIQTTTSQTVHMYGTGVIQPQVTVISQDYGSTWEDSVIVTPGGIYGVDTWAKKIWRYSSNQFELISDQLVQRFLNDEINVNLQDLPINAVKNVKSHYNKYKGDVMFTFYNDNKCWNLCYNERISKFVTKYSWTPLFSDNIQNSYISIDRKSSMIYNAIKDSLNITRGLKLEKYEDYLIDWSSKDQVYLFDFVYPGVEYIPTKIIIKSIEYPEFDSAININKIIPKLDNVYKSEEENYCSNIIGWGDGNLNDGFSNELETYIDNKQIGIKISTNGVYPWIKVNLETTAVYLNDNVVIPQSIYFVTDLNSEYLNNDDKILCEKVLSTKIYTHGRAGNYNEIDYSDLSRDNQIRPTYWYDKQEPFEFEFVVNTPSGIQKIFNNLSIISNNVEPNSLEISLLGDTYNFNKANIYKANTFVETSFKDDNTPDVDQYNKEFQEMEFNNVEVSQSFPTFGDSISYKADIDFDPILEQYYLKVEDNCRNIKSDKYGRRLGNIEYKEDKWNLTLTPIYYKQKELKNGEIAESKINSTRIRDKWIKIRIKYTGEKLVVISAIQTLMTLSFA